MGMAFLRPKILGEPASRAPKVVPPVTWRYDFFSCVRKLSKSHATPHHDVKLPNFTYCEGHA